SVSRSTQGSDGLLGGTAFQEDGARASGSNRPIMENQQADAQERRKKGGDGDTRGSAHAASDEAVASAMERRAKAAEISIHQALQDMPDMAELSKHVIVDTTPEGMRIQIVDQEGRAMFNGSSAEPLPRTQRLLEAVAKVIQELPNRISIS